MESASRQTIEASRRRVLRKLFLVAVGSLAGRGVSRAANEALPQVFWRRPGADDACDWGGGKAFEESRAMGVSTPGRHPSTSVAQPD